MSFTGTNLAGLNFCALVDTGLNPRASKGQAPTFVGEDFRLTERDARAFLLLILLPAQAGNCLFEARGVQPRVNQQHRSSARETGNWNTKPRTLGPARCKLQERQWEPLARIRRLCYNDGHRPRCVLTVFFGGCKAPAFLSFRLLGAAVIVDCSFFFLTALIT